MPTIDPKTGKPEGGAAKTRKRKAEREHERLRRKPKGSGESAFASLAAPPIGNTAEMVTWGAQALALTLYRAMQDPTIFETERDQLRFVVDACAKLGMIRDKAAEQEAIKRAIGSAKTKDTTGLERAHGRSAPKISRPPE